MTDEMYNRVLATCRKRIAEGKGIVAGTWNVVERDGAECCCPMSACGLEAGLPSGVEYAAQALGIEQWQVRSFAMGFDHGPLVGGSDWMQAGARMRRELGV